MKKGVSRKKTGRMIELPYVARNEHIILLCNFISELGNSPCGFLLYL